MFHIDPENKILQVLSKYFDIVWLTILWLLTSLPVVTLGTSTTALTGVMMTLASDTAGSGVTRMFFYAWRREWRQGLGLGLALLALAALAATDVWVCLAAPPSGALGALLWVGTILVALCAACAGIYACPVLARFRVGPRQLLHNVFILTIQHPVLTVWLLLLWAAALLLVYLFGFMGPLFAGPLLYAAANTYQRMFCGYTSRPAPSGGTC